MTAIEQATGTRRAGYNNYWIRPGVNTLEILQELGFTYHIDDLSADEPFLQSINGQPFATVPYTVHYNDIAAKLPRLQPGRLRAADDRRVRPAVRRGRHPAPGDASRPRFWINFQGRYDRLGSRLLAGSLGGVAFESAPVVRPGVRARNRDEGWVMASRKAREGYELGPR